MTSANPKINRRSIHITKYPLCLQDSKRILYRKYNTGMTECLMYSMCQSVRPQFFIPVMLYVFLHIHYIFLHGSHEALFPYNFMFLIIVTHSKISYSLRCIFLQIRAANPDIDTSYT